MRRGDTLAGVTHQTSRGDIGGVSGPLATMRRRDLARIFVSAGCRGGRSKMHTNDDTNARTYTSVLVRRELEQTSRVWEELDFAQFWPSLARFAIQAASLSMGSQSQSGGLEGSVLLLLRHIAGVLRQVSTSAAQQPVEGANEKLLLQAAELLFDF